MSGDKSVVFARDGWHVHVMPADQEADHDDTARCWCTPRVEFQHPNGGRVYLHRRANDLPYREPAGAKA